MQIEFYKSLLAFRTHSRSPKQIEFRDWLRNHIETHYQNIETQIDKYGNLYVQKGDPTKTVNCVIAHLDINQRVVTDNVEIMVVNNWILGIDRDTGKQIGLGHDDKTGVYFCLQALKRFKNLKVFFPLDEEVGCVGSRAAEPAFFENVGFMLQLDRRGKSDISTSSNGNDLLTDETQKELQHILDAYEYKFTRTISTDVGFLVGAIDIQGTNISCGYYNEHTNEEILNINQYENAESFGIALLRQTSGKKYTIEQKKYVAPVYNSRNYSNAYSTNSTVGKPLNVVKGGKTTNSNTHLFEKEVIDSYKKSPEYVKEISFDDFDEVVKSYPRVRLSREQKAKNFRVLWMTDLNIAEIATKSTEEIIDGYKELVSFLIKESIIPDKEILEMLWALDDEIEQVEYLGMHDLEEVKTMAKHFRNTLIEYESNKLNKEQNKEVLIKTF